MDPLVEAGIFLVDKPVGPTSFEIVRAVRRALKIKKVGHAGTLDPLASGLLIVCAGRAATRVISRLMDGEKEYEATLQLGIETDTQDMQGKIISQQPVNEIDSDEINRCLADFTGKQTQTPPSFSALKYKGKPLYYYARKGIEVPEKEPREIEIKNISRIATGKDFLTIRVTCSKGTYIRTLAQDIGRKLGPGACISALRRLRSGHFSVQDALPGKELTHGDNARELLLSHKLTVEDVLQEI
ncbi:MAG: tRNA pseudouridine(55) synthase TruB [Proteobacteria bacterium]|nr:tRNA pseudouridine(55) synthase TruB [Pseudomonadota bacterium]